MVKTWNEPRIEVQKFVPQEYASNACVEGIIRCAIPGQDEYECDGSSPDRGFNYDIDTSIWNGPTIDPDHEPGGGTHGLCGNETPITFSSVDGSGSGYEINQGQIDRNRPIYNISGYTLAEGTYKVVWQSTNGYYEYNHYGLLTIMNIISDRPNHS